MIMISIVIQAMGSSVVFSDFPQIALCSRQQCGSQISEACRFQWVWGRGAEPA